MKTQSQAAYPAKRPSGRFRSVLTMLVLLLFSASIHAGDAVTSTIVDSIVQDSSGMAKDSSAIARDTTSTAKKMIDISGIESNPWMKYTAMVLGIFVVVAFALLTSLRKNKPAARAQPPVGYRKHQHHHHPKNKI
jgi:hypothetical protein